MRSTHRLVPALALALLAFALPACEGEHGHPHPHGDETHAGEAPDGDAPDDDDMHAHAEESLGAVEIGGMSVELAQGHGVLAAGKDSHLVVKLPFDDEGATTIRAWIGTADRMASMVGIGEYARSNHVYDVHATAPDPLPADAQWWIEIEKPDGTRVVGSAKPLVE